MSNGRHGLSKKIDQLGRLTRQSLATVLSALLVFQPILANAQSVSAAGSAPSANQPSVGAAPNGVPLVDIVTPNGTGLSHNKYDNFNVGTPGLILNNFKGEVGTSDLGGVTPGNPNLKSSGPASVIHNEVTGGNRSALNGPTEGWRCLNRTRFEERSRLGFHALINKETSVIGGSQMLSMETEEVGNLAVG